MKDSTENKKIREPSSDLTQEKRKIPRRKVQRNKGVEDKIIVLHCLSHI
jgi:hypothetical protein